MTNSEQNVIFVYIYLDGGLRVGWFCTSTKTAHSYVIQSDASLSIQTHLNNNRFWHGMRDCEASKVTILVVNCLKNLMLLIVFAEFV